VAFICPARAASMTHAAIQPRTFVYHFTHGIDTPLAARFGAFHGLELAFVFNNFDMVQPTPEEADLSNAMLTYWTNFATAGDPNGRGLPTWPAYTVNGDMHIVFDTPISTGSQLRKEHCDFWFQALRGGRLAR
jgi:para-nitrobenzyl esterase